MTKIEQINEARRAKQLQRMLLEAEIALNAMPISRNDFQKHINASRSHAHRVLMYLKETNQAHIGSYTKTQCANAPLWVKGAGLDAAYPLKQIKVRYIKKRKQEAEPVFKLPERCYPKSPPSNYIAPIFTAGEKPRTIWRTEITWKNTLQT
jgi:hypothetical protein